MPVSRVGIGAARGANNASLTSLPLPSGVSSGQFLLALGVIRHRDATLTGPSDWSPVQYARNPSGNATASSTLWWSWKFASASEAAPTFTLAGGATGADIIGTVISWSGVDVGSPLTVGTAWVSGTSTTSQTIGPVPGISLAEGATAVLLGGISDDTSGTGPTIPSGWAAIPWVTGTGINGIAGASIDATAGSDVTLNGFFLSAASALTTQSASWTANTTATAARVGVQLGINPAPVADTTAPTAPLNVSAVANSQTQVTVSWNSSTDNVGVQSYRVRRNGNGLPGAAAITDTSFVDAAVAAGTAYSYTVSAVDAAGNRSNESSAVQVSTPPVAPVIVPDPANLWKAPQQVDGFISANPELQPIADQPQAKWINTQSDANNIPGYVTSAAGATLMLCIYAIPGRDSGNYSAGGFPDRASYLSFINSVKDNLGNAPVFISYEPDALGLTPNMTETNRAERIETLRQAVNILSAIPNGEIYIDASQWIGVSDQASLLQSVDVNVIEGITVNTSGYETQANCYNYANSVVAELTARGIAGKKFIVDSSRNGVGPLTEADRPLADPWLDTAQAWCNPPKRRLGLAPGTTVSEPNCRATFWIKNAGESDGSFPTLAQSNYYGENAPNAGQFWVVQARDLLGLHAPPATEPVSGTISDVIATFSSGWGPFTTTTATIANGRARIAMTTGYDNFQTAKSYKLTGGSIYARIYPASTVADMTEAGVTFGVYSSTEGNRAIIWIDKVTNTIRFSNESGYWDQANVTLSGGYSEATMAWVRIREQGGTLYWETSPDAVTWTVRKSVSTPSWASLTDNRIQAEAHGLGTTSGYVEVDNVNTTGAEPVVSVKYRANGSWLMTRGRVASGWGSTPKTRVNGTWV